MEQDYEKACYWSRSAAEAGDPYAQYILGEAYALGRGVETDPEQAKHWLRLSAEQDLEDAKVLLQKLESEE